jgi:hypothetical protein
MYLRRTTKKHKGKTYTNYLLVESVHTPRGPRQHVVCSLGSLAPAAREEWLNLAHRLHIPQRMVLLDQTVKERFFRRAPHRTKFERPKGAQRDRQQRRIDFDGLGLPSWTSVPRRRVETP